MLVGPHEDGAEVASPTVELKSSCDLIVAYYLKKAIEIREKCQKIAKIGENGQKMG